MAKKKVATLEKKASENEPSNKDFAMQQKKDFAKILFVKEHLTQKEIAERVGVSEQTMTKWVNSENWDQLKKSILITKQEQLANLYEQLSELNQKIKDRPKGERYPVHQEALIQTKLTEAIRQMETETSIAEVVDVFFKFGDFVRNVAPAKVREITDLQDAFIKSLL